jgi:hypothetical protein
MEFFLERTLPEFNPAGIRLNWSWSKSFSDFKNLLGDGHCTTWLEVLTDHFPKLLKNEPKATRELKCHDKKENFYHMMLGDQNLVTGNTSTCSWEVTILFEKT